MVENTIQHSDAIAAASSKVMYASSATAVATSFFQFNIVGLVAMVVGVVGLVFNIYFKHKSFKLLEAKTLAEMERHK